MAALDPALAGLVGALIGALAGAGGSLIASWLQRRDERRKWVIDKRVEAYAQSLRFLNRIKAKRSDIQFVDGKMVTIFGPELTKEWFDEAAEAQHWLALLTVYCEKSSRDSILTASAEVSVAIDAMLNARGGFPVEACDTALKLVGEAARVDFGGSSSWVRSGGKNG
jgi:hypothetical protein